jgi:hypothetical protein
VGIGRVLFVLLTLSLGLPTYAQFITVPADISVQMTAEPRYGLVPGQPIVFTLTVTNNGPDSVDRLLLYSSDIFDEFDTSSGSNDCQGYAVVVSDGETFHFNLTWSPTVQGILNVGESRTCHITLALSSQAPEVWPFSFGVAFFYEDINPNNNVATVTLRRGDVAPIAVPMLSIQVLTVLIVALASMACTAFLRNADS